MSAAQEQITFRLSEKQAQAWWALEKSDATEVFFGGAAGPGKTSLGCLWQQSRRILYPGTRGLIARDQFTDLRDSTLNTFMHFWNTYGRYNSQNIKGSYNASSKVFSFSNGSEILFRYLAWEPGDPDFHRLGSLEITDVFVDELPEISEKAWDILNSRIRYKLSSLPTRLPKALGCGNPANNWVKHRFVLDKNNKPVELKPYQRFISATLSDNPDKEFREVYGTALSKQSNYDQRRLIYGDWTATDQNGMEFYHEFKLNTHIQHVLPVESLPFHISFDQNVNPYITLTVWQAIQEPGKITVVAVDEICPEHPDNNTERLCELFLDRYKAQIIGNRQNVFMYGDASGNKRDTRGETNYNITKRVLKPVLSNYSDRTNSFNPSVSKRRDFINAIFAGQIPGISIIISSKCVNLVNDLTGVKQDVNGGKLKAKERNPITGQNFEKYGHTSDTMDYAICKIFEREFLYFCGIK